MTEIKGSEKRIYTGLDLFKLIAAILILLLHSIESGNFYAQGVTFIATRFAVPFFFITSGFFFCKGISNTQDTKKYFFKYEKKLLIMFFIWAILIYSPMEIKTYFDMYDGESTMKIILILIRRIFIIGPGAYWYLLALMISIVFIYFCHKKNWDKLLLAWIIVGLIVAIMYSSFNECLSNIKIFNYIFDGIYFIFSWEFNFVLYGIPFTGIGYLFCKYDCDISLNKSIILFVFSTGMRFVEYNLVNIFPNNTFFENNKISVFFILQAISLFMLAKNYNPKFSKETSKTLRQMSSFIYYTHWIVLYNVLDIIMLKVYGAKITYNPIYIFPKFLIVLLVCVTLFFVIKKINNKYLNILING